MKVPFLALFAILLAGLINETWATLVLLGAFYLGLMPFGLRHYMRQKKAYEEGRLAPEPDDDAEHDE
jgi:hypothetical protein